MSSTYWFSVNISKEHELVDVANWCYEQFGPGGRNETWCYDWMGGPRDTYTFCFRKQQDALFFTLRWL